VVDPGVALALERGVFTLSLDFELVWGSRDLCDDPAALIAASRITRDQCFDAFLACLERHGIVATWATVGHLFLEGATLSAGCLHPDLVPPSHAWRPDWFAGVPEGTEAEHPAFYARSLVERLRDAGQEVGSHSFSHPVFGEAGCSRETADSELARCVREAQALGVELRSFVFPRNVAGHVDLLPKHGFTCWRPLEPTWYNRRAVPGKMKRAAHLVDVVRAATPPTVLPERDAHGLWQIPASATFLPYFGVRRLIPLGARVRRSTRGIDAAAERRRVCHLYLHPINLADDPEAMLGALDRVFDHVARLRDQGRIEVHSMGGLAEHASLRSPA